MKNKLDVLLKKVVALIKKENLDYFVIGGLAAGFLGEPRMTQDIDLILFIDKGDLHKFLNSAKAAGFKFAEKFVLGEAETRGAFKLAFGELWVDFIIASTEFEMSALRRKKKTMFLGMQVVFPSEEDFILLKIIAGRDKDILDVKAVIERHKGKLDRKYLEKWAQALSDEAEDLRIWNTLQKLIE